MTGKLDLDLGEDYAFDPRRAREVAEEAASSGGGINTLPPNGVDGPNNSTFGAPFWIARSGGQGLRWFVAWNVDNDPEPDVRQRLTQFLADDDIDQNYRNDVEMRARALGWSG